MLWEQNKSMSNNMSQNKKRTNNMGNNSIKPTRTIDKQQKQFITYKVCGSGVGEASNSVGHRIRFERAMVDEHERHHEQEQE